MIKIRESAMVDLFLKQYSHVADYYKEVPVFAKSVDLVKMDRNKKTISAIEFKTNKWKDAESQALRSAIAFDYLYICLLKPATVECQNSIINECQNQGIGLYFLCCTTMQFELAVEAVHRKEIWDIQHKHIYTYLENREHE